MTPVVQGYHTFSFHYLSGAVGSVDGINLQNLGNLKDLKGLQLTDVEWSPNGKKMLCLASATVKCRFLTTQETFV